MSRSYRIILPLLGLWLLGWIYLSWAAIQDDALIHLRYADNLFLHHRITYDGVHPDYGASSLLYVAILAVLRSVCGSPNLPRATSSAVHIFLFAGLALGLSLRIPRSARVARIAGMILLLLLVTPSAVRWLDDGMETGIVVSMVSLIAWQIHKHCAAARTGGTAPSRGGYLLLAALGFFAVLLRTELFLLCAAGSLMIAINRGNVVSLAASRTPMRRLIAAAPTALIVGALIALGVIVATMHSLLPDTAIAKSHGIGHWINPIRDTAITLGGAYSFGIGLLVFWLLTLALVARHSGRLDVQTVLANCFCPVILALSALRGQEIQGVRYFAWTFFVPIVWNILELARSPEPTTPTRDSRRSSRVALYLFLGLLAVELPFESVAMHRVLTRRSATMRAFESQHLEVLQSRRGIASDIGIIGYFSGAELCDLAGLVNGRAAAQRTSIERLHACLSTDPDFLFVNASQLQPLSRIADLSQWTVCGHYDFTNLRTPDTHYLIVRPSIADEVCRATAATPQSIRTLL